MAKVYHSIPGIGSGRGGLQVASRSRIYQGPDHLLIMQSTGYTEDYKRIFYRDIRYVEVRKNNAQLWHGIVSGGILLLLSLIFYLTGISIILAAIFISPFLIYFSINLFRGSSCDCYVSTSVQTLKLPAPRRVKKIATLIRFLRTQAAAFQPAEMGQPTT